jgi:hypothetical protein
LHRKIRYNLGNAGYNHRGTCEQYIKEGKGAIKWTRLSCQSFAANAVRLQLHALAYDLGNFMRTLAIPKTAEPWSLTSLREKLIKLGAKVVSHGRYTTFQMAEVTVPRQRFQEILMLIAQLRAPPAPARPGDEVRCDSRRRQRYALINTKQRVSAQRGRASCRFGVQRVGCDRISLPWNPGRKIATTNFGIREMSVYMPRLEKFLRRRNKPRLLESSMSGEYVNQARRAMYHRAEMRSPVPSGLWRSKGCEDDPKIVAVRLEREERHAYLDAKISLVVLCCIFHTSKHSICGER